MATRDMIMNREGQERLNIGGSQQGMPQRRGNTLDLTGLSRALQRSASRPRRALENKYEEAKRKNEERYQRILKGYRNRLSNARGLLEGLGEEREAAIRRQGRATMGDVNQTLASTGLSNTTAAPTMRRGVREKTQQRLRQAQERMAEMELQTLPTLSRQKLRFQERRTDSYPNLSNYYSRIRQNAKVSEASEDSSGPQQQARQHLEHLRQARKRFQSRYL